jgi:hypothetical protein
MPKVCIPREKHRAMHPSQRLAIKHPLRDLHPSPRYRGSKLP